MVCVFKDKLATEWGRHLMYTVRKEETPVDKCLMCPAMNKPYVTDLAAQSSRIIMWMIIIIFTEYKEASYQMEKLISMAQCDIFISITCE